MRIQENFIMKHMYSTSWKESVFDCKDIYQ